MLLKTEDLKREFNKQYLKISSYIDQLDNDVLKDIHFKSLTSSTTDGIYIFTDNLGYHYAIIERGKISQDNTTYSLFELFYWVYRYLTHTLAFNYEFRHRQSGVDTRRMAFSKQLELLNLIKPSFKKMMEIELAEILEENPYNDNLFI